MWDNTTSVWRMGKPEMPKIKNLRLDARSALQPSAPATDLLSRHTTFTGECDTETPNWAAARDRHGVSARTVRRFQTPCTFPKLSWETPVSISIGSSLG